MEKIKIQNSEYEIIHILQYGNLLKIAFIELPDLSLLNLNSIEVLTSGGVTCATLGGYTTIYRISGNTAILSNDGSIYKVNATLVSTDGYIIDNIKIPEDKITEDTITQPVSQFFWKPRWNFLLKRWEESGNAPEQQPTEPDFDTRIDQIENAMIYLMME